MQITIISLFPEMFSAVFSHSIIKNAQEKKLVNLNYIDLRTFGIGQHQTVDDTPYGGGLGMVLRVDVVKEAIDAARNPVLKSKELVVLMGASGKTYSQRTAENYIKNYEHIILICGHYEGFDERVKQYIDEEISIGDFILTGGEIPAMAITDSLVRLIPGVFKEGVTCSESFSHKDESGYLLEYPQYTKPQSFESLEVPAILLSGNHKHIEEWRMDMARKKTEKLRPDLRKKA